MSATPRRDPSPAAPSIPTPGTAAYWRAQREAVALFQVFRSLLDDPELLLPVLRDIAAIAEGDPSRGRELGRNCVSPIRKAFPRGSARRRLAAHGHDVDRILRSCEAYAASWEEPGSDDGTPEGGANEPPPGEDWCPRGCQPLYGLGECGMCGHRGRGVWDGAASAVAESCHRCSARTRQIPDGICQVCGKHAEGADESRPAGDAPNDFAHSTSAGPTPSLHEAAIPLADTGADAIPSAGISFASGAMHVCVEFGISDGLASMTVFVAPADADADPGMGVLHLAPPPEQARAIGRTLLALADAAERGGAAR